MTIRISDFSDSVTSAVTPATNVPTGPAGADGAPGRAFQVDEFLNFTEAVRTRIEAYGTPGMSDPNPNHGLVTTVNPYVIVVETDNRSAAERAAGPTPLNSDVTRHVLEWSGAINMTTNPNGGVWFDYGEFTGMAGANGTDGMDGASATIAVNSTTTLAAGEDATVANIGTTSAANLDFGIPRGVDGAAGPAGSGIASLYPNGNADDAMVGDYTTSGTIGLTISDLAADAIVGKTFKITGATTGAKLISPEVDIPLGFRAGLLSLLFTYRSADADKIKINITDESGTLITSSENLVDSDSSTTGSASFNFAFNVGDNDKIKVEWEATGSVTEFLFDDVTVTPNPLLTLPQTTFTLSGGDNTFALNKILSTNENPASATSQGTFTGGATLTKGTDYIDAGDWIESLVVSSEVTTQIFPSNFTTSFTRYVITSKANIFTAPPVAIFSVGTVIDGATTPNPNQGPYTIRSNVITNGKAVITIQADFTGEFVTGSFTASRALFAVTATKTDGFGPATLVPNTEQTVVTYNEFVNKENTFSARVLRNTVNGNNTIVSQNTPWISSVIRTALGRYNITYATGFFTEIPSISVDVELGISAGANATTQSNTINGCQVVIFRADTGEFFDDDFTIQAYRQGTDYQDPIQTGTYLLSPDNVEIMNNQVTGDFSGLTIGTDLFSLGMNKAIENYEINEFSITITNEAATTGSGTLSLRLEKKSDGLGNTGWTPISTISTTLGTGVVTGTLDTAQTQIPKGSYVRIVPLTFKTDQESFHLFVQGARSNG